jgi:hypothetical protein
LNTFQPIQIAHRECHSRVLPHWPARDPGKGSES